MMNLEHLTNAELLLHSEEITFQNIIYMRQKELLRIADGEKAIKVIPKSNQRRKLQRDGVLMTVYKRGGKTIRLTPKALTMLEENT